MFDAIINRRIDLRGFDIEVEYHDIEVLNSHAMDRRADITKCSTALLPAIKDSYTMLDSGAALGRGNGPLLVRRKG
jgi:1,4-dihydroxy-6-naphthoate synthase